MTDESGLIGFLRLANGLKQVPRTGWLDRGVPADACESVADHSLQVALLAWLAAAEDPTLDRNRVLQLALVHDLAEAVAGDPTPYHPDDLPVDEGPRRAFLESWQRRAPERTSEKQAAERAAIDGMTASLPRNLAVEIHALWEELESRATPEAAFVKQADKLETWLQSRAYLAEFPDVPMASFDEEIAEVVTHPALVRLRDAAR